MSEHRQLKMILADLSDLPPIVVPEDYEIRTYRSGDEDAWARIMNTGVGEHWNVGKARQELTGRPRFDPNGLFLAVSDGEPVGSACAWRSSPDETGEATVHMLCVLPEARGNNLGYVLSLHVLHYFRERGISPVSLSTDDHRIPAIRTYLKLGFEPVYFDDSHVERWERVRRKIEASR